MSRILVLGAAPLPFEPQQRQYAANLRTWHFTKPLLDDGHELLLIGCRLPNTYPDDAAPESRLTRENLDYVSIPGELFHDPDYVQRLADELDPQAVVGVNTYPASRAVLVNTDKPIWCDLNGWIMAEAQTKCRVYDDDRFLSHFWKMECAVLDRADVISTVTRAQAHATVGELALSGRLGKSTFGYDFVHAIPNAISAIEYEHTSKVIRDVLVPDDAFVVLWVGGYNTWTDVDLLYEALTSAMARVGSIHFVSTGGVIEGHDDITFQRFRDDIARSRFAERFHFAGWVPTAQVASYYFESDLGINVDGDNYETVFGARNRLNDMMKVGLPVLTTIGTEISEDIAEKGLGLTCATGDAEAFAERITWAARHRDELRAMGRGARDYAHEHYSYASTTEPLRAWARDPCRAPDLGRKVELRDVDFFATGPDRQEGEATRPCVEGDSPTGGRVHAVVVHHRGQRMLECCLESLLECDGVHLDVVVVLNHCQEDVPEIAERSSRVHLVVSETSLGFSNANNLGVRWARENLGEAEFYYFVNNDTESTPQSLNSLVRALGSHPGAAMAGPKLLILGAADHYNSLGLNVTEDGWGWDEGIGQRVEDYGPPPPLREVLSVTGSALLIDATVFHRIGGWTEAYEYYFEDIDLGIKVWKSGRRVVHVPDAVVYHQISATMTEGSERKVFFFWRNRLVLALIHWPIGLLVKTFRRALQEIRDPRRDDHPIPSKAMRLALGKLPTLAWLRWRLRGKTHWRRFLVPPGSVPVIHLPEIDPQRRGEASAARRCTAAPRKSIATELRDAREELAAMRRHTARLETRLRQARRQVEQIHTSKMWRFWMLTINLRRWLTRPFGLFKPSS